MVERHAQTQSVIMAEQYLANSGANKDQICTQRSFCDIATNEDLRSETSIAAAEAIRYSKFYDYRKIILESYNSILIEISMIIYFLFPRMMEKMLDVAGKESSKYVTRQKYPHISQLVASSTVGKVTKDRNLCKSLFPCNDETKHGIQVSFSVKLPKKVITETNSLQSQYNNRETQSYL